MFGETAVAKRSFGPLPRGSGSRHRRRSPTAGTGPKVGGDVRVRRQPLVAVLLFSFCCSAQWSGVYIGSFQFSDVVLVVLLVVLVPGLVSVWATGSSRDHREVVRSLAAGSAQRSGAPTGPAVFVGCIGLAEVLYQFFPASLGYLGSRVDFNAAGTVQGGPTATTLGLGTTTVLLRYALALGGGWLLARYAAARGIESWAHLIALPWLLGSVVSGTVALLESAHLVDLSGLVTQATGERASGLAFHPNSLGFYLASSIPFLAQLFESRAKVLLGLLCTVAIWGGLLAADSRIALVVAAIHTVALPIYARNTSRAAVAGLLAALLCSPLIPYVVGYGTHHTRLANGGGSASDVGRSQVYRQAFADFEHSPMFGIGIQNGGGAPSVPLGMLAGGGLIAAFGYAFFWIWSLRKSIGLLAVPEVRVCLASGVGILVCGWFQNNVTDRGEYLLILSAVWLASAARRGSGERSRGVKQGSVL